MHYVQIRADQAIDPGVRLQASSEGKPLHVKFDADAAGSELLCGLDVANMAATRAFRADSLDGDGTILVKLEHLFPSATDS